MAPVPPTRTAGLTCGWADNIDPAKWQELAQRLGATLRIAAADEDGFDTDEAAEDCDYAAPPVDSRGPAEPQRLAAWPGLSDGLVRSASSATTATVEGAAEEEADTEVDSIESSVTGVGRRRLLKGCRSPSASTTAPTAAGSAEPSEAASDQGIESDRESICGAVRKDHFVMRVAHHEDGDADDENEADDCDSDCESPGRKEAEDVAFRSLCVRIRDIFADAVVSPDDW